MFRSPENGTFFLHLARDLRHGKQRVFPFYHDLGLDLVGLIAHLLLVEQLFLLVVEQLPNPILSSSNVSKKSLEEAEVTHILSRRMPPISLGMGGMECDLHTQTQTSQKKKNDKKKRIGPQREREREGGERVREGRANPNHKLVPRLGVREGGRRKGEGGVTPLPSPPKPQTSLGFGEGVIMLPPTRFQGRGFGFGVGSKPKLV